MKRLPFIALWCVFAASASAQVPVALAPVPKPVFTQNGAPLVNGCFSTFAAGTTTPLASYTDSTGTVANTNPIILDANGSPANAIYLSAAAYKFQLKSAGGSNCSSGSTIWTADNVSAAAFLNLPNTWTALQTFSAGIAVAGSSTFTNAGVFTNVAMQEYMTSLLGGINLTTERAATQGGTFSTDAFAAGLATPVGATQVGIDGIAAYVSTAADSASRTKANTVGVYAQCRILANNSACWAFNGLVQDIVGQAGHSMTDIESDLSVFGAPSFLKGHIILGFSGGGTVIPATAAAFEIATNYKWPFGFICDRASCNVGLQLNDLLATNPSASQFIQFVSHDGGGGQHLASINTDLNGVLNLPIVNAITAGGVAPAFTGSTGACATITTFVGASWSGSFKCTAATGASTIVIIPGLTAANGWSCSISDTTTAANVPHQSAYTTTNCTISGTVNQNDVLTFTLNAF